MMTVFMIMMPRTCRVCENKDLFGRILGILLCQPNLQQPVPTKYFSSNIFPQISLLKYFFSNISSQIFLGILLCQPNLQQPVPTKIPTERIFLLNFPKLSKILQISETNSKFISVKMKFAGICINLIFCSLSSSSKSTVQTVCLLLLFATGLDYLVLRC